MAPRIEYCPATLSFDDFHKVDAECFPDEPDRPDTFARSLAQDFWAAFDGDSLGGFCYGSRRPELAYLLRLGVAAAYRGRGIGTRLMQTMVDHYRRIGLSDMILYVLSDNRVAIRLYERFGFRTAESAFQFVLADPLHQPPAPSTIRSVPINEVPRPAWPHFPPEWATLPEAHNPPEKYVFLFCDFASRVLGYCRLDPRFPGCFPFVLERPHENLAATLRSLREYLLPDKNVLKLTFSSGELADACTRLGLQLNYRLFKMSLSGGNSTSTGGRED